MKLNRKTTSCISIFAAALLASTSAVIPANAAGATGDIVVMHWMGGQDGEILDKLGEAFEKQNPDADVEFLVTQSQGDPRGGLRAALLGGEEVDMMINTWPAFRAELIDADFLYPLEDAWKENNWSEDLDESWKTLSTNNGSVYGLNYNFNNRSGIWYNPTHLAKAGISIPSTWDDLVASFGALKAAGYDTPVPMPAKVWAHAEWFESLLLRVGGVEASNALAKHEIAWTDPVVKKALTLYIELIAKAAGTAEQSLATEWSDAVMQIYGAETSNYTLLGGWVNGHAQGEYGATEGKEIGIFQFPALGLGHDNTSSVDAKELLVMQASDNKPTAIAFADFIVSEEGANIIASYGNGTTSKHVDSSLYGPVMSASIDAVSKASVQFVLGDLLPGDLVDEYRVQLQKLIQNPTEAGIESVMAALEAKAQTSY